MAGKSLLLHGVTVPAGHVLDPTAELAQIPLLVVSSLFQLKSGIIFSHASM
jgi:hypothetical protein